MSDPVEPFVQTCLDTIDAVANMTTTVPPAPSEWAPTLPMKEFDLPDPIVPGPPPPPTPNDPMDPSPGVP